MADNADSIRALYAAFARGDVPAVLGMLADDASWTEAEGFPYGGTYIGPTAVLENVFMRIAGDWNGFTVIPDEFVACGDVVVALGHYSGTSKATGKSFKAGFSHVWTFAAGKIARFVQYTDTAVVQRALQA